MEQIKNLNEFRDNKDNKIEKGEGVLNELVGALSSGDINKAMRMKDDCNIPHNIINSPEVQDVAKKAIVHTLPRGRDYVNDAFLFSKSFNISEEDISNIVKDAVENEEMEGRKNNAILIKEKFSNKDTTDDIDVERVA